MEMERSRLVSKAIDHIHDYLVASVRFNGGYWPLAVNAMDCPGITIWASSNPTDIEIVGDSLGQRGGCKRNKWQYAIHFEKEYDLTGKSDREKNLCPPIWRWTWYDYFQTEKGCASM